MPALAKFPYSRLHCEVLAICQSGYEPLLRRELSECGLIPGEGSSGWVSAPDEKGTADRLVFAHIVLTAPQEFRGESVNSLARSIAGAFLDSLKGRRIDAAWPNFWLAAPEAVGLGRRLAAVERACHEEIATRISRVARLGHPGPPRGRVKAAGLFVFFADFGRAFVATEAFFNGQRRMADDDAAPSRSYLKVEEAYGILGREPQPGETVVDLGAAPGGWSYSAAKRGAEVKAVDNGPLKGGALNHPRIAHVTADAFGFRPLEGNTADWLFCDLVEEPHHVLDDIVAPWLSRGWCRHFVINFKFGRVDPIALISHLRSPASPFTRHARDVRMIHLYHDREELTVCGSLA